MAKKDQRLRYSWPLGDVGLGVTAPKVENPCITFDSPKTSVIPWYMQGIVHTHTHTPQNPKRLDQVPHIRWRRTMHSWPSAFTDSQLDWKCCFWSSVAWIWGCETWGYRGPTAWFWKESACKWTHTAQISTVSCIDTARFFKLPELFSLFPKNTN